jgi:hypothetical protein
MVATDNGEPQNTPYAGRDVAGKPEREVYQFLYLFLCEIRWVWLCVVSMYIAEVLHLRQEIPIRVLWVNVNGDRLELLDAEQREKL